MSGCRHENIYCYECGNSECACAVDAALRDLVKDFAEYVAWLDVKGPRSEELLARAKAVLP